MNSNSRIPFLLMVAGGIFAVAFGLFLLAHRLYEGITGRDDQVSKLQLEETNLQLRLAQLERARKEVSKWKAISLPGNLQLTAPMYGGFLQQLMLKHKLNIRNLPTSKIGQRSSASRGGGPAAVPISYSTTADGTFQQITSFLTDFYSHNLPHSIRSFTLEPLGKGADARMTMTMGVEVLTMSSVPDREFVTAVPDKGVLLVETLAARASFPLRGLAFGMGQFASTGLYGNTKLAALVRPERKYSAMLNKNVFATLTLERPESGGASPIAPDKGVLKNVQLTYITANNITEDALLRNRMTNKYLKLRADGGFNTFEIRDGNEQVVLKGKVLAIKPRNLVFETGGKAYQLYVGQFMEDALKKELTAEELKAFEVEVTATDHP